MDHEYSTSALSNGQTGWDWFALQLSDQTEVMVYQIRRKDGQKDPYSSGTFVNDDNRTQTFRSSDFVIQATGQWKSPITSADYPSGWRVEIPSQNLQLDIQPYILDQENRLTFSYWEGAVKISGTHNGKPVTGVGYVELTGYSGSLAGQF
jgi:predicted secreted hydrolase